MLPSASALGRALECPASCVLPATQVHREDAIRGTSIHRFIRVVARGVPIEEAIKHVAPKWQSTCWQIDWSAIVGGLTEIRSENAFAIDADTQQVRFLGEDIGRDYSSVTATEYPGSEDIGGIDWDGIPCTSDIKTGFMPVAECSENSQVKFFALRIHLETGADRVRGRILYVREDGSVRPDVHVFTRIELEDFADELSDLIPRIEEARAQLAAGITPATSSGPWCRFCPAVSVCPSKTALARALGGDSDIVLRELRAMTPERQGEAYVKAKEIKRMIEMILDGFDDIARRSPFSSRPGKIVKEIAYDKQQFSNATAIELLHSLGATREQIDSCYRSTPVRQIRELNDKSAPKVKKPRARKKVEINCGPLVKLPPGRVA